MNCEEYLAEVLRMIRENFRPNDSSGSMAVASAAYLVKQRIGVDHTVFGFAKFKEVLSELERRGLIRTGLNTKQAYAIWIGGTATHERSTDSIPMRTPFRLLRNPVWFAFVSESPSGRRFLNRISGEVRVGLQEPLEGDWVEITPVDPSSEREEATRFLLDHQLNDLTELQEAISSQKWYFDFPHSLAKNDPQFASEWKRQRSNRVVTQAEKWCSENRIPVDLVFKNERPRPTEIGGARHSPQLREVLLSAIQRMTTERLLDLEIPARFVIAAIRPELLDN
ncbi:MAG: hypothetical protein ACKV0T_24355 [Planctomycetales bacterium]